MEQESFRGTPARTKGKRDVKFLTDQSHDDAEADKDAGPQVGDEEERHHKHAHERET